MGATFSLRRLVVAAGLEGLLVVFVRGWRAVRGKVALGTVGHSDQRLRNGWVVVRTFEFEISRSLSPGRATARLLSVIAPATFLRGGQPACNVVVQKVMLSKALNVNGSWSHWRMGHTYGGAGHLELCTYFLLGSRAA